MPVETIDTLVIGAGQAGVAMSEHLGRNGTPHIVLEKDRIAESWRTRRWDSLVANGPAWHDRFPNMDFPETPGDGFPPKEEIAAYFEAYAKMVDAPVRTGVEVTAVDPLKGRPGFLVTTSAGAIEAKSVVVATGAFQTPVIPPIVPQTAGLRQMHSSDYRNPADLPMGAVMVVGAGSSGAQIAEELGRAGRKVYLSVGPHDRPPRAYRGRDFVWWLGVLGKWDMQASAPGTEHVTIAVSGANGGETMSFRRLGREGITLVGRTESCTDGVLRFAPDIERNILRGDDNYLALLDEADAYIARNGLDLPEEPEARQLGEMPACVTDPLETLDLKAAGVGTIIWATGFSNDYGWLHVDAFDETGRPKHQRGVSAETGIYFLGLPWLSGRGSSFIWGVWHDARYIADHIAIRAGYNAYTPDAPAAAPAAQNA
ncbi:NAD(P)/FAD-dependent oxidoreductase [Pseudooceanicola sp. CBS1P-1]|uniref:SidA/IucD/PvdA family monooxygenase n=1 Tax=Pseudooceanicola albus TaxID=2692189 RepID=A0A6L7G534_9RHOB|nr:MULTISPECIES: NAD(P)/FAD-dependent oxidoreductase [Pseudooceanicola]MBT9385349.1 NAD(P)/FAD-dependent oxidoreductase [Pseudooceanicola endophyticus]MXN18792.1 SidA/IucD/PvdA family monooxygenase [Pseudooceanicola albus]